MTETIVLTGVTSGFGALALKQIADTTDHALFIGARKPDSVTERYGSRVTAVQLDLTSLESVRAFCAALAGEPISVLGLNAGMQTRSKSLTEDGFETTFQVNYLSHFLMFQELRAQLTETARIVTTGSGTHDPEENTPVPAPKHANVGWLAHPDTAPKSGALTPIQMARAYSTSKLLCILMAREIAVRHPRLEAASFDPGYLPDTNLSREYPAFLSALVKRIVPFTMKNDRTGSSATTAPEYVRALLGTLAPDENGGYLVMRSGQAMQAAPSELARQPGLAEEVWDDSLKLLS